MIGRRQFVQIVFASSVATVVVGNTKKSVAHEVSDSLIYGVRAASGKVILQSLDLNNGTIKELSAGIADLVLESERISGLTLRSDCTWLLSTAPAIASVTGRSTIASRVISLASQTLPEIQGLNSSSTIESLLVTNDERPICVVSLNQGNPPFAIATIDLQTGQLSFIEQLTLPPNQRFSNLAQCPDGHLYATSIAAEGSTNLVELDLDNQSLVSGAGRIKTITQLKFNNKPLLNDVASLAYSPANQLFALADPTYQGTNSVFRVDENTGSMELLANFAVDKIAFACVEGKQN